MSIVIITVMNTTQKTHVLVRREDLCNLSSEIQQLTATLPTVLAKQFSGETSKSQQEVAKCYRQLTEASSLTKRWKAMYENLVEESQKDKQRIIELQQELEHRETEISQHSEFWNEFGASLGTMLWRVSKSDSSVECMLTGNKIDDFFNMSAYTLSSFVSEFNDDWPGEASMESLLVISLAGTITNITASAIGREALLCNKHSHNVIMSCIECLLNAPPDQAVKLQSLMLMILHNLSMNKKGVRTLCDVKNLLPTLVELLEKTTEQGNILICLQLLQVLVGEENGQNIRLALNELLKPSICSKLQSNRNKDIVETWTDLLLDLHSPINDV